MGFFRDTEHNTIISLEELKADFYSLTFAERGARTFGEYLSNCLTANNGILEAINEKPLFSNKAAKAAYWLWDRIQVCDDFDQEMICLSCAEYFLDEDDFREFENAYDVLLYKRMKGCDQQ